MVAQLDRQRYADGRTGNGESRNGESRNGAERLARGLGWASLGLGAASVAAPRGVARMIGMDDDDTRRILMRGPVGAREIVAGVGILSRRRPVGWLWARVAGDVFDLAVLSAARVANARDTERRRRVTRATAAVALLTVADIVASVRLSRAGRSGRDDQTLRGRTTLTIRRPVEDVYAYWRDFENLPGFMEHLESVRVLGNGRSRWKAKAPVGKLEWEAEIVDDRPNELIAWRSVEGARVRNTGSVRFRPAPADQGTEVTVDLAYDAPGGKVGAALAKLLGEEPGQQISDDLRRFKQVMETGEVARSEASPGGTSARIQLKQRPGQPLEA
ncbi:MAG TPA: SRPBCC family protein [Cryptosporangiaceae bacterium]|nr:SRPBCC family protein [Cryptosporangiaceae bacterium]